MSFVEKNLWLATNFAAKMIKENGYRNKAIKIASNYYKVNPADVEAELNKRISKSTKGKKRESMKTWEFNGTVMIESEAYGPQDVQGSYGPFKATSLANARKKIDKIFESKYGIYPPLSDSYYVTWYVGIRNSNDIKEIINK